MSETTVTITLGPAERDALERYRLERLPGSALADAARAVLVAWAARQPDSLSQDSSVDEGLRPEQLNASNDI
ncbi:MAG: hypothetical protein Q8S58_06675 [Bosea sp. (in: a-proteobacteria)]|uniref:hypothetical protein n=1 Tax=Bosea sp. (in: a-proteobacteria) TaxID=1871050 RepID=UPI002734057B|nr:hypothetical protein [Bosea sp. (in: a-proteobacteria)]MDP3255671.1 hypothetical protein [Bosea sp. (in: a-proteobacteria)]MDP3318797.1 hypothetical protein [Bosea sp. (in: a-proteobacteria)]